mmetsp:Transcript_8110/g.14660  ORF Transcript_8110/g.14660 Transcript_8110/m.14660 type:complete len:204 (+) Transcript_8110:236-847(+)
MSEEVVDSTKNPYQQWLERIQQVMKEHSSSGWVTVRCTDEIEKIDNDNDAYGNEMEGKSLAYTQEEVEWIRCVLLPPERELALEEMTQLILGDQYGHSSSFADNVLAAFEMMNGDFKNKRMWSRKLNILFGFTLAIQQYDSWMEHNEGGRMDGMINEIGTMWNRVLKRSNSDLAIDDEFSRPGIECFLLKFQDNVGDIDFDFF